MARFFIDRPSFAWVIALFIMVVGADNKVTAVPVKADAAQNGSWIVSSGLKGGERVIVEGFQKTKPGGTVNPAPWKGPVEAAPGGAPAAPATPAQASAQAPATAAPAAAPAVVPAPAAAAAAK